MKVKEAMHKESVDWIGPDTPVTESRKINA